MAQEEQNSPEFNIELPEEVAGGVYSNLAVVMAGQSEFVLDFVNMMPGQRSAKVRSRVIMTPENLKRLMRLLQQNVHAYEQQVAVINLPEDNEPTTGDFGQGQA